MGFPDRFRALDRGLGRGRHQGGPRVRATGCRPGVRGFLRPRDRFGGLGVRGRAGPRRRRQEARAPSCPRTLRPVRSGRGGCRADPAPPSKCRAPVSYKPVGEIYPSPALLAMFFGRRESESPWPAMPTAPRMPAEPTKQPWLPPDWPVTPSGYGLTVDDRVSSISDAGGASGDRRDRCHRHGTVAGADHQPERSHHR